MTKGIKNANAVAHKLRSALTRVTNHRLKVPRKEKYKREEMFERQKTEAIAAKRRKDRRRISLSKGKEGNHKSNTGDDTDLDQAKNKYLLQLWVVIEGKLQTTKKRRLGMADGKKKEEPE